VNGGCSALARSLPVAPDLAVKIFSGKPSCLQGNCEGCQCCSVLSTHFESVTGCFVGVWRPATSLTNAMVDDGTERVNGITCFAKYSAYGVHPFSAPHTVCLFRCHFSVNSICGPTTNISPGEADRLHGNCEGYVLRGLAAPRSFSEICVP